MLCFSKRALHLLPHMVSPLIFAISSTSLDEHKACTRLGPGAHKYCVKLGPTKVKQTTEFFQFIPHQNCGFTWFPLVLSRSPPSGLHRPPSKRLDRSTQELCQTPQAVHPPDDEKIVCFPPSKNRTGKTYFVCREKYCLSGISHLSPIHPELRNQRREKLQLKCCA